MRLLQSILCALLLWFARVGLSLPVDHEPSPTSNGTISPALFNSLEELSRLVDISYCVGSTGIRKPFQCASRCNDFEGFELVSSWHTGPLMSDSCGYVALSHPPWPARIVVAFRGTYSIANTVADLSTVPQQYVPYPGDDDDDDYRQNSPPAESSQDGSRNASDGCDNCTVHMGFMRSWHNTRPVILPHIVQARSKYPDYQLTLVGHSLGGAVAALASLEFQAKGWNPQVTTFGEPRIGNRALMDYVDKRFNMADQEAHEGTYRRVTHRNDPVPLLPLEEWGFTMHAGEVFISKVDLPPSVGDIRHCRGDEDPTCIAGTDEEEQIQDNERPLSSPDTAPVDGYEVLLHAHRRRWEIPTRYKLWELFVAHRDYFWRLGLCVPGGDPKDWYRKYYPPHVDGPPQP